jgi:hypothetical protein
MVYSIEITEDGVSGSLEIILNDLAVDVFLKGLPHAPEAFNLGGDVAREFYFCARERWIGLDIDCSRVDVGEVRAKIGNKVGLENSIFVEAVVFGLIERGPKARVQKQNFEKID